MLDAGYGPACSVMIEGHRVGPCGSGGAGGVREGFHQALEKGLKEGPGVMRGRGEIRESSRGRWLEQDCRGTGWTLCGDSGASLPDPGAG